MENLIRILLYSHVAMGSIALITFWIPAFSKKGGSLHRKVGNIYVYCMYGVVITAFILSVHNVFIGEINMALFLGFLSFLSATPLWHGTAVLQNKRTKSTGFSRGLIALNIITLLFGAFLMVYGIFFVNDGIRVLFIFFGFLGLTSISDIRQSVLNKPYDWYQEHYKGLITSGIAAYTAFLAFGGRQFLSDILPGMWQVLPWVLPTIIGVVAMRVMDRVYKRKGSIA